MRVSWCLPLLLSSTNAWALTVTKLELSFDGRLVTTEERGRLVNAARCACEEKVEATFSFGDRGSGGDVVIMAGDRCVDDDQRLDTSSCTELWKESVSDVQAIETISLPMQKLAGGDCSAAESTETLFVLVDASDDDRWVVIHETTFGVDTEPPDAPTDGEVIAGESLVEVAFEVAEDAETSTQYQVLCRAGDDPVFESPPDAVFDSQADRCGAPGSSGARAAFVCREAGRGSASVTVQGLDNGTEYTFSVVAVDEAGNPSEVESVGSATPALEEDLWERYRRSGGLADEGHCFVATAAYGDYDDSTVRMLRVFRDARLAQTAAGRELIALYYAESPPAAAEIADRPLVRAAAREVLSRLRDFVFASMFAGGGR